MRKIIPYIIVLAAGFALGVYYQKQPEAQKDETKVRTAIEQAGTDVKEGVHQADEMATNVEGQVKTDAQKVGEVATNAVGEIKGKLN
jgi:uncharacterized protein with FMN-binding domain